MPRLIDAEGFKSYIDCGHLRSPLESCFSEADVVRMIDKQPTIDAVEVVRCKDCGQSDKNVPLPEGVVYCNVWDTCTTDNGFCHQGAKMDGGKTDEEK